MLTTVVGNKELSTQGVEMAKPDWAEELFSELRVATSSYEGTVVSPTGVVLPIKFLSIEKSNENLSLPFVIGSNPSIHKFIIDLSEFRSEDATFAVTIILSLVEEELESDTNHADWSDPKLIPTEIVIGE